MQTNFCIYIEVEPLVWWSVEFDGTGNCMWELAGYHCSVSTGFHDLCFSSGFWKSLHIYNFLETARACPCCWIENLYCLSIWLDYDIQNIEKGLCRYFMKKIKKINVKFFHVSFHSQLWKKQSKSMPTFKTFGLLSY